MIPFKDKIGYGTGNFSTGVINQVIGTYLVFYCTAILDIPGSMIGIAMSTSIIWDALTDPLMGHISDITRSKRFGRRHQYILIGGAGMAAANLLLWNLDKEMVLPLKFGLIVLLLLTIKTFSTIYVTPYTALGAELSDDYNERTEIQGVKTIFFLLGLAFVSVFGMYVFFRPTGLFPAGQLNPDSYSKMGFFSSVIIIFFSVICFGTTKKYIPVINEKIDEKARKLSFVELLNEFKTIFMNSAFRAVSFSYMFNNIASALIANMGLHVFTYTFFLNSQQIAAIVGIQFAVSILAQPIWFKISQKLDKRPSMILGIGMSLVSCLFFAVLTFAKDAVSGSIIFFIPFALLAGFGTSGLFTLPLSMMADVIDFDEVNSGKRAEGSYYGFLTMFYKLSQSITLLLIGWILQIIGFDSDLAFQTDTTAITMGLVIGFGSAISFIASMVSVFKYSLNKEKVIEMQNILNRK
ncbi:MFS transporter [Alkalibacter mobilis]|uniref:MFS transporter n=1 Tax=Alkalibacter mobilis TaxID=2787712 RepID=UPI00189C5D7A|nr:MFS transporter [Alkalibacter mobilis]MBF7097387.1 MFS transporter [Alkalibacter mobilis]